MSARVLLATGHDMLLNGLEGLLLREDGIRSVALAANGVEALRTLKEIPIDVAVLEVDLPGLSGIGVIERARSRRFPVRCIALAKTPTRLKLERIMRAGAAGIVSMSSSARVLAEAVRCVHGGHSYVSAEVTDLLITASVNPKLPPGRGALPLTVREREVLRLIAEDCSSREIASKLGISTRTVETHRAHLMEKLDLRKTAALVRFAVREGLTAA